MAEYLSLSNRLYLPRKLRFGDTFIQDLNALSQAMVGEVVKRTSKDPRQVTSLILLTSSRRLYCCCVFQL